MLGFGALLTLSGVYALASFDVANDPDLDEGHNEDGDDCEEDKDDGTSRFDASSSATPAAPLLSSVGLEDGVATARPSAASSSSPNSTMTRRTSIIQMRNNHRRRRSSVRFSLKPEAYAESFGRSKTRTRLSSVIEDGGTDGLSGGDVGYGTTGYETGNAAVWEGGAGRKTAPSLSRFASAPSVSTTPSPSDSTSLRRTFSAQPDTSDLAERPRTRTRTYTATLFGGLGIA